MNKLQTLLYVLIHLSFFILFALSSLGIAVLLIEAFHISSVSIVTIFSFIPILCFYIIEDNVDVGLIILQKIYKHE
jgi:hypothetical protein